MKKKTAGWKIWFLTIAALVWICAIPVLAEGASGDNSLSTLGITNEGVTVSPDFLYSTIEYNVTVPAGTTRLDVNPITSNENAWIVDITGQDIGEDGTTTVKITVSAENGVQYAYYLYVTTDESTQVVTEAQTEPQTEKQTETEPETEDPRYIKVDRTSLEEAEHTIETLKNEVKSYRDRQNLLTMILYGMIAVCVVLLFVVINLLLKKRDLKAERDAYVGLGYEQEKKPSKSKKKGSAAKETGMSQPSVSYEEEMYWRETEKAEKKAGQKDKKNTRRKKDDPADVPKPSQAKKQARPMPEYQAPEPEHEYNPPKDTSSEKVEINMIDL